MLALVERESRRGPSQTGKNDPPDDHPRMGTGLPRRRRVLPLSRRASLARIRYMSAVRQPRHQTARFLALALALQRLFPLGDQLPFFAHQRHYLREYE